MPKVDRAVSGLSFEQKAIAKASQYGGLASRGMLIISESGLYSLILKSRKPEAQRFKK